MQRFTRTHSVFFCLSLLGLLAGPAACSSKHETGSSSSPTAPKPDGPGNGSGDAVDPNDPANQAPHALGTIILGESHDSRTGEAFPFVSASFVPDAATAQRCTKKITDACELAEAPKCTTSATSGTGCGTNEVCAFDKNCAPKCQKVAVCSKACEDGEICTLDAFGKAACSKVETFDAGPLAFTGTSTAITLFPPYTYKADGGSGAPFVPGAEIKVLAQGPTDAGFEKFNESFTATTFIQSKPQLNKVSREELFGTDDVPVSWVPGSDSIVVTVGGTGGSVACKATDSDGKFTLPRAAIDAALGDQAQTQYYQPTLVLSLARQRMETKKGEKTTGTLSTATVQPEGWLEFITSSTETTTFQGCQSGYDVCGSACADLTSDETNCGSCGHTCTSGQSCVSGACKFPTPPPPTQTCAACLATAKAGTCSTQSTACQADTTCKALDACLSTCTTTTCASTCFNTHPPNTTAASNYDNCIYSECSTSCY
jgi:hypothetical protein